MVQPASSGQMPLHTSPSLSLGQHRLAGSSSSHLLKIDSSKDSSSSKHYHHGGKQQHQQDQQEGQDLVLEVLVAKVVVAVSFGPRMVAIPAGAVAVVVVVEVLAFPQPTP